MEGEAASGAERSHSCSLANRSPVASRKLAGYPPWLAADVALRRSRAAKGGAPMGKVLTHMTMSLDGFIADPADQPGELFDWYQAGPVSVASANENIAFDVDEASAELLGELTEPGGVIVSGRRLFD